ncbi:hypothetical protein L5515_013680 [Caenorhabditis briggsae]|uniref:C3H1-type domain-containing protein n=2 Tax=Caenorhabditis briggsae TaxID=6238 RepID=A0AAE9J7D0_CAEBR|nr:hypothetical protein L5515_013680 [Caenorhabditis briggsae]
MSTESLEDGEIASEHEEQSPEQGDFNDEVLIDQIIQNENGSAQRIRRLEPQSQRPSNRAERRSRQRNSNQAPPQPAGMMATSWHTNGNSGGNNGGNQFGRPPPPESVIFGIPNSPSPQQMMHQQQHQQQHMQIQQMAVSPDITRLQNIVNHNRDFYQPPPPPGMVSRVPFHYFQDPPIPNLMSIPIHRPPPPIHQQSPMIHGPNTSWRTPSDNYDEVFMDVESPAEPPYVQIDPFVKPPVHIPLNAVPPSTTPVLTATPVPPQLPKTPVPTPSKVLEAPSNPPGIHDDEESLRALLLAQIKQPGKRTAEKSKQSAEAKRIRKNSSRLSSSAENAFGAQKPVQTPPPAPKIQVNIGQAAPAIAVVPETVPVSPTPLTPPPADPIAPVAPQLTREERRAQLDQRMQELEESFRLQREKVSNAAKQSKTAATMAAEAAELAKKAEQLNQEAVELRQKCIEDTKNGKEEMRKMLIEKRELQTAIDEMSIDDMEEIDVEEFPVIFFATVKKAEFVEKKIPKQEPATNENGILKPQNPPAPLAAPEVVPARLAAPEALSAPEVPRQVGGHEARAMEHVQATAEQSFNSSNGNETNENVENGEEEEECEVVEGEDEYDTDENEVVAPAPTPSLPTSPDENGVAASSPVPASVPAAPVSEASPAPNKKIELELRARLLNKVQRKSPRNDDSPEPVVTTASPSSTTAVSRAEECRQLLYRMCKFELNGKCEKNRGCSFLHLHGIKDRKTQEQVLEGMFREFFQYKEVDIEPAIGQTMHFMPTFNDFEKLMDQFFKTVIHKTPEYKPRLFNFFAQRR